MDFNRRTIWIADAHSGDGKLALSLSLVARAYVNTGRDRYLNRQVNRAWELRVRVREGPRGNYWCLVVPPRRADA